MIPKVSVIVPVYNTGEFLRKCLDSILNQTLKEIEIICINDGSTDNSFSILQEYKQKDSRIIVLTQENKGAGNARNAGLNIAKGEYLSFLDSDDYFSRTTLRKTYNKAIKNNADIIIFDTKNFDNSTGKCCDAPWRFNRENFPRVFPFSYKNMPESIFKAFCHEPWNKIFRREFITAKGISFQEIRRGNDIFFTWSAMISAIKIDIIDEPLVYYRTGLSTNLQSNNDETPLDFYYAFKYLKQDLKKNGKYDEVKDDLKSTFFASAAFTLSTLKNGDNFCSLYNELKKIIISEFRINNDVNNWCYNEQEKILTNSCANYLFTQRQTTQAECSRLNGELDNSRQELSDARQELDSTHQALSETHQELGNARQELSDTHQKLGDVRQDLNGTRQDLSGTRQELSDTRQELNSTRQDLSGTRQELSDTRHELNSIRQDLSGTYQELSNTRQELVNAQQELANTRQWLSDIRNSYSFRFGRMLTWFPRKVRGLFR